MECPYDAPEKLACLPFLGQRETFSPFFHSSLCIIGRLCVSCQTILDTWESGKGASTSERIASHSFYLKSEEKGFLL